jgi:hypothetical protein
VALQKVSWTDRVRNEVLRIVKEERNILRTIKRNANWIGHILHRDWLLKHIIEGMIEGGIDVMGRQGRRCKQLLGDFRERRGYSKLKNEALY